MADEEDARAYRRRIEPKLYIPRFPKAQRSSASDDTPQRSWTIRRSANHVSRLSASESEPVISNNIEINEEGLEKEKFENVESERISEDEELKFEYFKTVTPVDPRLDPVTKLTDSPGSPSTPRNNAPWSYAIERVDDEVKGVSSPRIVLNVRMIEGEEEWGRKAIEKKRRRDAEEERLYYAKKQRKAKLKEIVRLRVDGDENAARKLEEEVVVDEKKSARLSEIAKLWEDENEEEAMRLEKEMREEEEENLRLEREKVEAEERKRVKEEEVERLGLEQEREDEERRRKEEEEERLRLEREHKELIRREEEEERLRLERKAEEKRIREATEERRRQEEEDESLEEAEKQRLKAEDEKRLVMEEERSRQEEERLRLEAEEAEKNRIKEEEERKRRNEEEERLRLEAEEAETKRKEEEEWLRREKEIEEIRLREEKEKHEMEEAERKRREEDEHQREEAEKERLRLKREAEEQRAREEVERRHQEEEEEAERLRLKMEREEGEQRKKIEDQRRLREEEELLRLETENKERRKEERAIAEKERAEEEEQLRLEIGNEEEARRSREAEEEVEQEQEQRIMENAGIQRSNDSRISSASSESDTNDADEVEGQNKNVEEEEGKVAAPPPGGLRLRKFAGMKQNIQRYTPKYTRPTVQNVFSQPSEDATDESEMELKEEKKDSVDEGGEEIEKVSNSPLHKTDARTRRFADKKKEIKRYVPRRARADEAAQEPGSLMSTENASKEIKDSSELELPYLLEFRKTHSDESPRLAREKKVDSDGEDGYLSQFSGPVSPKSPRSPQTPLSLPIRGNLLANSLSGLGGSPRGEVVPITGLSPRRMDSPRGKSSKLGPPRSSDPKVLSVRSKGDDEHEISPHSSPTSSQSHSRTSSNGSDGSDRSDRTGSSSSRYNSDEIDAATFSAKAAEFMEGNETKEKIALLEAALQSLRTELSAAETLRLSEQSSCAEQIAKLKTNNNRLQHLAQSAAREVSLKDAKTTILNDEKKPENGSSIENEQFEKDMSSLRAELHRLQVRERVLVSTQNELVASLEHFKLLSLSLSKTPTSSRTCLTSLHLLLWLLVVVSLLLVIFIRPSRLPTHVTPLTYGSTWLSPSEFFSGFITAFVSHFTS